MYTPHPLLSDLFRLQNGFKVEFNARQILQKLLFVLCVYLLFGLLLQQAYASTENDPYQSGHGSVWILPSTENSNNAYIEALQLQTDVRYTVTGTIARVVVRQQFKNNSAFWAEGIYVFPLPENAAVDHFRMIIGKRIIEGQIKERVHANTIYQSAKRAGKKGSLIEQQRPNVFTTSIANIAPGESLQIELEFQQVLDYKDDYYRLRFPMVVGPRYQPRVTADTHQGNNGGTAVTTETENNNVNQHPVHIRVLLDAGTGLDDLKSAYHRIDIIQTSETRYSISTVGENMVANRDFELQWKPQLNDQPQLSAFSEKLPESSDNKNHYTMLTLLPPSLTHLRQKVPARDVIFVIDVSGSMDGTSIQQAKKALITALDRLSELDRFNVIWFNDKTEQLFAEAVSAQLKNKHYAKQFINRLQSGGGTEMLPAMKMALTTQPAFSRLRQVIFITDGNISNETELFRVIDRQLGNSRLFTIGIGSAPNAYFMRKAAQKGRGSFTFIGDINEVQEKTGRLFKKLEVPALINLKLQIDGHNNNNSHYEIFPETIADLYAGEIATIYIKGKNIPQSISLIGDYGSDEWHLNTPVSATTQSGIGVAWARKKITSLMDRLHSQSNENDRLSTQQQLTDTALKHHLVSRYTSLVAVDVSPVNTEGMLLSQRLKNNRPLGWNNPLASNGLLLPQTASSSRLNLLLAILLLISAVVLYRIKNHVPFYR